jgi:hypothetical protein
MLLYHVPFFRGGELAGVGPIYARAHVHALAGRAILLRKRLEKKRDLTTTTVYAAFAGVTISGDNNPAESRVPRQEEASRVCLGLCTYILRFALIIPGCRAARNVLSMSADNPEEN